MNRKGCYWAHIRLIYLLTEGLKKVTERRQRGKQDDGPGIELGYPKIRSITATSGDLFCQLL